MAPSLTLSAGANIDVTVGKSYGTSKRNSPKLRRVSVFYLPNQTGFTNGLVHSRGRNRRIRRFFGFLDFAESV